MTKYFSFDEIVSDVVEHMSDDDTYYLTTVGRNDMIRFHSSVGMHIRNYYRLWDEKNPLTKAWHMDMKSDKNTYISDGVDLHPNHPDAVSGDILGAVWDEVNG